MTGNVRGAKARTRVDGRRGDQCSLLDAATGYLQCSRIVLETVVDIDSEELQPGVNGGESAPQNEEV